MTNMKLIYVAVLKHKTKVKVYLPQKKKQQSLFTESNFDVITECYTSVIINA